MNEPRSPAFDLVRIGAGLPVSSAEDALRAAMARGTAIVTAPPGSGKTTLLPPLLANAVTGRVIVTAPRRVAVRAAAARIAHLDGSVLGERVGFTVRGERALRSGARIEFVTPGVLLKRLLADPELRGIDGVILDEVHERSVDSDLLMGLLAEVRLVRENLVLVAMSATLDAGVFDDVLADPRTSAPPPHVDVPAALHPLDVSYAPASAPRLDERGVTSAFLEHLAHTTLRAHEQVGTLLHEAVDALVFVPGAREVARLCEQLAARTDAEVVPLHGGITPAEQTRAVSARTGPDARIIVSTSLAESSLTVPGVRLVIDSGLSREPRRDSARDMQGLVTVSAARASAEQRSGRAARVGPGYAVRAYSESDFARMPRSAPPAITTSDLTDASLTLAAWGTPRGAGLTLPTTPPPEAVEHAERTLRTLGLVAADGSVTPRGAAVSRLPVGVRAARALLAAVEHGVPARSAAETVAALSGDYRGPGGDLTALLRSLRSESGSRTATRTGAQIGGRAAASWRRERDRLERLLHAEARPAESATLALSERTAPSPGFLVALGYPERIGRRVGPDSRQLLLAGGTRAALPPDSSLLATSHTDTEWIAVWEVQRSAGRASDGTGAIVRLAAPLTVDEARLAGAELIAAERSITVDADRVRARERTRLGSIVLDERPVRATADEAATARRAALRDHGLSLLAWSKNATTLRARLALLHRELGSPWPSMADADLLARADDWLDPALAAVRADAPLTSLDVERALGALLPWPDAGRLDDLAPEYLFVPSGSRIRIDYSPVLDDGQDDISGRPIVAVKLQELFGLSETPRLADGRAPIVFHLLSPARRQLAITADLTSFWNGPYHDVRREMRGRYPKHPWPEDPWNAVATARTTARSVSGIGPQRSNRTR